MANANADEAATGTADEVDTSTNDDAQETDDTSLEDMEINFDDVEDDETGSEESGDEETDESDDSEDDSAATESDDDKSEKSEDDAESDDSTDEDAEEDTASDDDTKAKAAQNDAAAKARIADREAKRVEAKAAAQQKYLDDAADAADLAVRQLQVDAYNNRIENNTSKLVNGVERAKASIDLMQNMTPEIQTAFGDALDDFERMYVVKDANGDPIQVKGDVFQYLQKKAESIRALTGLGARKQVKDKTNQKKRTFTPPSKAPKKPKTDPMLEGFDEEAAK